MCVNIKIMTAVIRKRVFQCTFINARSFVRLTWCDLFVGKMNYVGNGSGNAFV